MRRALQCQCGDVPRWNCSSASASHGAGIRATSSRFLSARASRRRSRTGISIRARQRTRRNFVRLIPKHITCQAGGAPNAPRGQKKITHKWRWSRGPRPRMDCPFAAGRLAARTGTRATLRTGARTRRATCADQAVPCVQLCGSSRLRH